MIYKYSLLEIRRTYMILISNQTTTKLMCEINKLIGNTVFLRSKGTK